MYDMDKIRSVLEGFRTLPDHKWDQDLGYIYTHNMSSDHKEEECGACVGAWCAVFLDLPTNCNNMYGKARWYYEDGALALADLLHIDLPELEHILSANGAWLSPFSEAPWRKSPYPVLRDTVRDITRYDHDEYLRNLPVPHKEVEDHEALEAMP